MKSSTRKFWQMAKITNISSLLRWIHGYIYGRWVYQYIALGTGRHPLTRRFINTKPKPKIKESSIADSYHGKVISPTSARKIVNLNRPIKIDDLEQIIPYKNARSLLLEGNDDIVVLDCPCRLSKKEHCTPVDVCLVIGAPFTDFILEHHPHKSRKVNQQEAEEILQQCHEAGNVHHAFFKEEMLSRFYAICNCCSCCCCAIEATKRGTPMLASSGYKAQQDELCISCGRCVKICPFDALEMVNKQLVINYKCMGCGVCVTKCPQGSLHLERDKMMGEPLEIQNILNSMASFNQSDPSGL